MANLESAISFVREHGNVIEQARLNVLLEEEVSKQAINELSNSQREDGSWAPFWSPDSSSIDATCYRLAVCEQLGLKYENFIDKAIAFLVRRQNTDGSFAEAEELISVAPPWAQPRDPSARLYLTANAGFWLRYYDNNMSCSMKAAQFLDSKMNTEGYLPTFLHANWLAAGLFYSVREQANALSIMAYLKANLSELNASNLAWLVNTLVIMEVPTSEPLIQLAVSRLNDIQHKDGHWESEDGHHYNVHTTLESMRAICLCS